MIMKIHRLLGVTLVFFILILSITGTLLQHAEDFNIRNNYAPSSVAKTFYNIMQLLFSSPTANLSLFKSYYHACVHD